MKTILVLDCSGSMSGSPQDRMIRHIEANWPADTVWTVVAMERVHSGTVADINRIRKLPMGGSEMKGALEYTLAPGVHPVVYTDDGEDLGPLVEAARGHSLDIVVIPTGGLHGRIDMQGLGTITHI